MVFTTMLPLDLAVPTPVTKLMNPPVPVAEMPPVRLTKPPAVAPAVLPATAVIAPLTNVLSPTDN